jgi:hypothetical protein
MKDYKKLVKALRNCSLRSCDECDFACKCIEREKALIGLHDAADAIEALQAEVPKRGEWITIRLNNGGSYTGCSCCEAPIPTDTMLDYIPESESKYCYSCGAKMEVQE